MYLGARKEQTKKQTISDSWSPSVLRGPKRTHKKDRQYQTTGVLVCLGARKEQTKKTDNTRQLESYVVYFEAGEEQTKRTDNTCPHPVVVQVIGTNMNLNRNLDLD